MLCTNGVMVFGSVSGVSDEFLWGVLECLKIFAVFVGISGVQCRFGGDWRGLLVYLGGNEIRSELLGGFGGFF